MNGWTDGEWMGAGAPTLEITDVMKVYQPTNPVFGTVFTRDMIEVNAYSKLCVDLQYDIRGKGYNNGFGIHVTKVAVNGYSPLATYFVDTVKEDKSYNGVVTLDISRVTGWVFIGISSHMHTGVDVYGYNTVTIRKMWLE